MLRILGLCAHLTSEERRYVRRELMASSESPHFQAAVRAVCAAASEWCQANGTTLEEMQMQSRSPFLVRKRRALYAHLRTVGGFSLVEIGRALKRDHTTILAGLRKCS